MPGSEHRIVIRFDGLDADSHEIDLMALGESLKGIAKIAGVAGQFAATQEYIRSASAQDVKLVAREPRANCFSMDAAWVFVQQQQILSGAFGSLAIGVTTYIVSSAANKREEMKQIKDSLDIAIRELGNRDKDTVARLLDIVENMATDLKGAARQAVAPIGKSARTLTIAMPEASIARTYDEADAAEINKPLSDEFTDTATLSILITEMDLVRGTCKAHMDDQDEDKRVPATITDPLLGQANNQYSLAFAAGTRLNVQAKMQLKDGNIVKLFISDLA